MSANLRLLSQYDHSKFDILAIKDIAQTVLSVWLKTDCELESVSAETIDLPNATTVALQLPWGSLKFAIARNLSQDRTSYFKALSRIAADIDQEQLHVKLISPLQLLDNHLASFRYWSRHSKDPIESLVYVFGEVNFAEIALAKQRMRLGQLNDCSKECVNLKLFVGVDSLAQPSVVDFYLKVNQQILPVEMSKHNRSYVMTIENVASSDELVEVPLKIKIGDISISAADYLLLQPGSVIEFKHTDPLKGFLELDDGTKLAEVSIDLSSEGNCIKVQQIFDAADVAL